MTHTAEPMTLTDVSRKLNDFANYPDDESPMRGELQALADAIDAELAKQSEAELVGYRYRHSEQESWHFGPYPKSWWECQPLYTHPQQRNAVEGNETLSTACCPPEKEEQVAAALALGSWMSAALDDPKVCEEMKRDINRWFEAAMPVPDRSNAVASRDREDAERYRWMRDHIQPFINGNESPHVIVNVCLGEKDGRIRLFDLIDKAPHVGVVSLDQAVDAARRENKS
jgi:hypothetical protein